jgi:hypothetical protein
MHQVVRRYGFEIAPTRVRRHVDHPYFVRDHQSKRFEEFLLILLLSALDIPFLSTFASPPPCFLAAAFCPSWALLCSPKDSSVMLGPVSPQQERQRLLLAVDLAQ